ncbi:MAG: hypothetical protein O2794_02105 [bacterium]|nr:hypothetical protein [bacterium]
MNSIVGYITWQYSVGIPALFNAWFNIHWFLFRMFSIPTLLGNFFSPLYRIKETRRRGFDIQDFFEVIAVNSLMRIVGMVVRTVFVFIGVMAQVVGFVIGGLFVVLVLFAPILAPLAFLFGFVYAIS